MIRIAGKRLYDVINTTDLPILGQNPQHFPEKQRIKFPVQSVVAMLHAEGHIANDDIDRATSHRDAAGIPLHKLHIQREGLHHRTTAILVAAVAARI